MQLPITIQSADVNSQRSFYQERATFLKMEVIISQIYVFLNSSHQSFQEL